MTTRGRSGPSDRKIPAQIYCRRNFFFFLSFYIFFFSPFFLSPVRILIRFFSASAPGLPPPPPVRPSSSLFSPSDGGGPRRKRCRDFRPGDDGRTVSTVFPVLEFNRGVFGCPAAQGSFSRPSCTRRTDEKYRSKFLRWRQQDEFEPRKTTIIMIIL